MNIAAFASFVLLSTLSPGPNNIMTLSNATKYGFKRAERYCFGVLFGCLIAFTACTVFTSALFNYMPMIEPVMKWVGAAYMLALAVIIYRDRPHEENGKKRRFRTDSVMAGFTITLTNVKFYLFALTALTTFILPYYTTVPQLVFFIVLMSLSSFLATSCWALFGSAFQKLLTNHSKAANTVMALMLVYCAVSIALG